MSVLFWFTLGGVYIAYVLLQHWIKIIRLTKEYHQNVREDRQLAKIRYKDKETKKRRARGSVNLW